jgi:tellurium resistance protein TerD
MKESFNLKKGTIFNLTKEEPGLKKIMFGLGWDFLPGFSLDLDVSVFMLGEEGKLVSERYFVFYNNTKSIDGAIQHTGDNRTGQGDGDDESILMNLGLVNDKVVEIVIVVSIYDAIERNHNFGLLKNAYIRLYDVDTKREILIYDLDEKNPNDIAIVIGRLVKINEEWRFQAIGEGNGSRGLEGFVERYA